MNFTPLFKPFPKKPITQFLSGSGGLVILKDAITISAWLALGGVITTALFLTIGRIAFIIPITILAAKTFNTLLIVLGLIQDPFTKQVLTGKYSAQLPNDDGTYGPEPAKKGVTVLLIGVTVNHALGILAPGFKEAGVHMVKMQKDINENSENYGLLGSSSWMATDRDASNGTMSVMYFKDAEGLHKYAHDPIHRDAWNWWNKVHKEHLHLMIWHETYVVPAGHWETIYVNGKPHLLGAATAPIKSPSGTQYLSTVVDARKGVLKSSKGRLTMTDGNDNDGLYGAQYQDLKSEA